MRPATAAPPAPPSGDDVSRVRPVAGAAPVPLPATVEVGRILRPHGLLGEFVVAVLSDVRGRFRAGRVLRLVPPSGPARTVKVATARKLPTGVLLRLVGVDDRDGAEALRGSTLEVSREAAPPAPDGSFYWFELVGCTVVDAARGELGVVEELLEDGGGLLLRVVDAARRELLVPWVESFLRAVDVAGRHIEVALPEGFVEACMSPS